MGNNDKENRESGTELPDGSKRNPTGKENESDIPTIEEELIELLKETDGLDSAKSETEDHEETAVKNDTFAVKEVRVPPSKSKAQSEIDRDALAKIASDNAIESDKEYRKQTEKIITITSQQLRAHTKAKKPLRFILMCFVILLLSCQFAALVLILFLNQAKDLQVSDFVINVYIVSLFVETLAGLIIMIKFAFDSQQEVKLIEILNNIVRYFKKYGEQ